MTLETLMDEIQRLPDAEKWQLVRHLLDKLEGTGRETHEDWHSFVNRMYGALADDLIERPSQLPITERELID